MLWTSVLLAYDNSPTALRAVEYVGQMFSKVEGVKVTVFTVYEKIPEYDMVETPFTNKVRSNIEALRRDKAEVTAGLEEVKKHLCRMGFEDSQVTIQTMERKKSVAKDIVEMVRAGGFGTVVLGSHGQKGSIFGSIANDVLKSLKDVSVVAVA
ncbi:UspA domain protein [Desulfarculus baarsii DSM 2075]|uniref:UspA domain protein n=1 Tax=Desulfarculus baarsii (strain ATCC 33931 / DSM 2075 / LMG 7858 / VKM B-1802 / 2st14) TaxID=644282 RepID=E1QHR5_DESB2|nr:universal stress protein [Desulfarculus baarsii]ADK85108.1 UspA domain protein [Desulfarculus baarsii DSM 2075]